MKKVPQNVEHIWFYIAPKGFFDGHKLDTVPASEPFPVLCGTPVLLCLLSVLARSSPTALSAQALRQHEWLRTPRLR